MSQSGFRHIYGPVPSRRLGRSLGIDLIPFKTCTYDCVYCQLGRTTNKTISRREYVPVTRVLAELQEKLVTGETPDYISLAGSGEPTLNSGLGDLITGIKSLTDIPVAVLTNGSLLWIGQVQDELMAADVVLPSLDAGDDRLFQYVNRPHRDISFEQMVAGLVAFTKHFRGEVWLEVFLLGGVTEILTEVEAMASIVRQINPARVQLNSISRPPAEEYAFPLSADQMLALKSLFPGDVDIVSETRRNDAPGAASDRIEDADILALLGRRPCTSKDIAAGLGLHITEVLKRLETLITTKKVETVVTGGRNFYSATHAAKDRRQAVSTSDPDDIERYLRSCQTEFWKGIFRVELEVILQYLEVSEEILSVGCGPAIIEGALSERGFRVTGLDISRQALDHAPGNVRTVSAPAEDMPFPASSFDAVVFVASLQFIEQYRKALEEATRVLRPRGKLLVLLLNPESGFIKGKSHDPDSYINKILHIDLRKIEAAIAPQYYVHGEYLLGVKNDIIFTSHDPSEAVLYVINGIRKPMKRDEDA